MQYKDYYKTLGVERGASREEIKRAYRRLARKYHPDVSEEADAEARFKEISEAYEVLHDPEKRAAYDRFGSGYRHGQEFRPPPGWQAEFGGFGGGMGGQSGFSSFFEELFGGMAGGGFGQQRARRPRRGQDLRSPVSVSLEEAFHGTRKRLDLGAREGRSRSVDVSIPAGVTDGQQIRLRGQGAPGPGGGPAGDLLLEVNVRPHPRYRLEGRDVHLVLPVMPWEAALGTTLKVPTLGGPVELKLPPGSEAGRKLRLRGRGLPGEPGGDQYVELRVQAPPAEDDAQRALYRRMAELFPVDPRAELEG